MTDSSKEKIDEIFWRLSCKGGTEGINKSEAKQAIQALIDSAVTNEIQHWLNMVTWPNTYGAMREQMEDRIKELSNTKETK